MENRINPVVSFKDMCVMGMDSLLSDESPDSECLKVYLEHAAN